MIKILIVLGLIVLSTQKHGKSIECGELDFANCANKVNCRWGDNETNGQCFDAVYKNLGSRRVISQSVIFDNDDQCDKLIKSGDFIARKTFTNKYFRSWCGIFNINAIKINNKFYYDSDVLDPAETANSAIIYPAAREGTALLYTNRYFRGDSWVAAGPTKLNGQVIRSIALGLNTRLSLYDRKGRSVAPYLSIPYDSPILMNQDVANIGIENVLHAKRIEYILLEDMN